MNYKPRTLLLVATAIATAFTLGKSLVHPKAKPFVVNKYTFPESVSLSTWKQSISKPVNSYLVQPPAYISGDFISGKHYRYLQSEKYLDIEMRYLANTNGDLKSFIISQTGELSSVLRQDRQGGFYTLYTHEDKAYLSACINPHGGSTITSDQFNLNLMVHDTHLQRLVPWLLGQKEFRDKRCLWAHLSMVLDSDVAVEETYSSLEAAWFDWHNWWRSHFPQA